MVFLTKDCMMLAIKINPDMSSHPGDLGFFRLGIISDSSFLSQNDLS